jgi:hypothetical protein
LKCKITDNGIWDTLSNYDILINYRFITFKTDVINQHVK